MPERLTPEREAIFRRIAKEFEAAPGELFGEALDELVAVRTERDAALEQVKAVLDWAIKAYHWEHFWVDRGWRPESAFDANGKKLRDFIEKMQVTK